MSGIDSAPMGVIVPVAVVMSMAAFQHQTSLEFFPGLIELLYHALS